jgi:hypothetical protein
MVCIVLIVGSMVDTMVMIACTHVVLVGHGYSMPVFLLTKHIFLIHLFSMV